jgi:tetratricopeptide (TPR) repeat protein
MATILIRLITACILFAVLLSFFPKAIFAQNSHAEKLSTHFHKAKIAYDAGQLIQAVSLFEQSIKVEAETIYREDALYGLLKTEIAIDSLRTPVLTEIFANVSANRQYIKLAFVDWAEYELNQRADREAYKKQLSRAIELSGIDDEEAQWTMLLAYNEAARDSMDAAHNLLDLATTRYKSTKWAPEARYQAARWHLQAEQFADAAKDFELLRSVFPQHEHSRAIELRLGESYYKNQEFDKAIIEFKRQLPLMTGKTATKAVYLTAESYNVLGDYDNATTWYLRYQREMETVQGDARPASYGLGWVYMKQNIYHWAVDAFAKAGVGDDELAQKATYYLAVSQKLSGKYEDALNTFSQFFERFSDGIWAERIAYEWAVTAFELGDYSKSIQILLPLARKADQLEDPGPLLTFLGEAFFANGEYTSAITAFDEAAKNGALDPKVRLQATFQKGWVLYRNQAFNDARANFEQVYRSTIKDSVKTEALFWSADCSYQLEEYDRSAAEFRRFLQENPVHQFNGAAMYSLGWAQFMRGEFEDAAQNLEGFLTSYKAPPIAIFPYDTDTQLRLGDSYFALGRYDDAIRYYTKAIGAEPGGDYAMYQIANSYYRSEQTANAIDEFAKLLRIYPYTVYREQAQFNIGYLWFLNGQYLLAIENYEKVIKMGPRSNWAARAQYNIGDALFNEGKFDSAIVAYQEVLNNYPRSDYIIEAANGIQYAQLASGQDDTSNELLQDFIKKNPRASTLDALRYRKAESLFQSGDYANSIKAFEQYLVVSNSSAQKDDAIFQIAEAYRMLNNFSAAEKRYKELITNYPSSELTATALATLGKHSLQNKAFEQSLSYFRDLEKQGARYQVDAWLGQAEALTALNNFASVTVLYNKVLAKNADNAAAKVGLGILALKQGKFAAADSLFTPVADQDLSELGAKALFHLALVEIEEGDLENALVHLAKVPVLFGIYEQWVTRSGLKTIEIYLSQNRKGDAAKVLQNMQEKYPESEFTKEAKKLVG